MTLKPPPEGLLVYAVLFKHSITPAMEGMRWKIKRIRIYACNIHLYRYKRRTQTCVIFGDRCHLTKEGAEKWIRDHPPRIAFWTNED